MRRGGTTRIAPTRAELGMSPARMVKCSTDPKQWRQHVYLLPTGTNWSPASPECQARRCNTKTALRRRGWAWMLSLFLPFLGRHRSGPAAAVGRCKPAHRDEVELLELVKSNPLEVPCSARVQSC